MKKRIEEQLKAAKKTKFVIIDGKRVEEYEDANGSLKINDDGTLDITIIDTCGTVIEDLI